MVTTKRSLKKLASSIVLSQGNRFIKELLRDNKITIGTTKADFHKHLMAAIEDGQLRQEHFDKWLHRIEGWGDQHIYLYRVDATRLKYDLHNTVSVKKLSNRSGFADKWNIAPSLMFPKERQLTSISCEGGSFRLTWNEGWESWQRDKEKDFEEKEGTDLYQYRAYRRLSERSVIRFEWPNTGSIAALFVQLPWDKQTHEQVKQEVWKVASLFLQKDAITKIEMSSVIKGLDQKAIGRATGNELGLSAQATRLKSGGASIEFSSLISDQNYARSQSVRQVRNAVNIKNFEGDTGLFLAKGTSANGLSRDIKLQLFQESDRVKVWMQCTKNDIWTLIHSISELAI